MEPIEIFIRRMKKIGIEVELVANYPWIYLDKVNGKKVKEQFLGEHGFTAFWSPVRADKPEVMTDIKVVFNKIRETLNS